MCSLGAGTRPYFTPSALRRQPVTPTRWRSHFGHDTDSIRQGIRGTDMTLRYSLRLTLSIRHTVVDRRVDNAGRYRIHTHRCQVYRPSPAEGKSGHFRDGTSRPKVSVTMVPPPSRFLMCALPPCCRMTSDTIDSPSPLESVRDLSPVTKRSKT